MVLVLGAGGLVALAAEHPVPKDRTTLTDCDWLPHVVSKIAPLEWWSFASSTRDIHREDYPGDLLYAAAKQDTWHFPHFCFSFFRPKPEAVSSLLQAVNEYKGDVTWSMSDFCITAVPGMPTYFAPMTAMPDRQMMEEFLRNPPKADPEFVRRAMLDAPRFAAYLEERLGLKDKPAVDFDPHWLTQKGLAESRAPFENYVEPGDWSVVLAFKPQEYARVSEPSSPADRSLSMGISEHQNEILLQELGAVWQSGEQDDEPLTPLVPGYPLLARLSDLTEDAYYEANEVDALLAEYLQAQAVVKNPQSIRGLDNLIRIARWAQKLKLGIYFGGQ